MTEQQLHIAVCDYIRLQYPKVRFKTDLSGIYLGNKWSLQNLVKKTSSHRGFPDLFIYHRSGSYVGLAIELKREGTKLTNKAGKYKDEHIEEQAEWLRHLIKCGFEVAFACGFDQAKSVIDQYLKP